MLGLSAGAAVAQTIVTSGAEIDADVSRGDGEIAMDLAGSIWTVPSNGGQATLLTEGQYQASRPRWSPDAAQILFQTSSAGGNSLWLLNVQENTSREIGAAEANDQLASWHPDGERIVFSSSRSQADLDIWEMDLPTGLTWRLTRDPGDELEPVWSADGNDLAYINRNDQTWSIVLKRRGEPARALFQTSEPISALSWRPDGTLLTFLQSSDDAISSNMLILSEPPLLREFASGEDFGPSAVAWQDRFSYVYTADGQLRRRNFGDWKSQPVPFSARIEIPEQRPRREIPRYKLPVTDPAAGRLVIRSARLFDGIWPQYRETMDILVEDGKIAAVEPRQDWPDATLVDLGNLTVLPGFIDSWSRIPPGTQEYAGLVLLSYGITTVVSDEAGDSFEQVAWEGEKTPGPRLLPALNFAAGDDAAVADGYLMAHVPADAVADAREFLEALQEHGVPVATDNWNTHLSASMDILMGVSSMPRLTLDPGIQRRTGPANQAAIETSTLTVISGLADAATPGLDSLRQSRQAVALQQSIGIPRRHSERMSLAHTSAMILVGSQPNGLPPGLATHAEFLALSAAGLTGEKILRAAGRNPAMALALDNQVGTITPGALADLVLVNGDPLSDISDATKIVAVVRNGRFYSIAQLLERAAASRDVE